MNINDAKANNKKLQKTEYAQKIKEGSDNVQEVFDEQSDAKNEIFKAINKYSKVTAEKLAPYLFSVKEFYSDKTTGKIYWKDEDSGIYTAVDTFDIANFLASKFGPKKIRRTTIKETMEFISEQIDQDYRLIFFENGYLDTSTMEFKQDSFPELLPKLRTELTYTPDAEEAFKNTWLYEQIEEILDYEPWDWNSKMFYLSIGAAAQETLIDHKFTMIVGKSGTRKTTLLTLLKRIFEFSQVKLETIADNKKFSLLSCLRKDINIDDDANNFRLSKIGFLNSFISGAGGDVEIKNQNEFAQFDGYTTPYIFGAANKLPSVTGEGFPRRICLIKAENVLPKTEVKNVIGEILEGKYDQEIGLLFSYCLQLYYQHKVVERNPFVPQEIEDKMMLEWKMKSYPHKEAVKALFCDKETAIEILNSKGWIYEVRESKWYLECEFFKEGEGRTGISKTIDTFTWVEDAHSAITDFLVEAFSQGRIAEEHKTPSATAMSGAMNNQGFSTQNVDTRRSGQRVRGSAYVNCILLSDLDMEDLE